MKTFAIAAISTLLAVFGSPSDSVFSVTIPESGLYNMHYELLSDELKGK